MLFCVMLFLCNLWCNAVWCYMYVVFCNVVLWYPVSYYVVLCHDGRLWKLHCTIPCDVAMIWHFLVVYFNVCRFTECGTLQTWVGCFGSAVFIQCFSRLLSIAVLFVRHSLRRSTRLDFRNLLKCGWRCLALLRLPLCSGFRFASTLLPLCFRFVFCCLHFASAVLLWLIFGFASGLLQRCFGLLCCLTL